MRGAPCPLTPRAGAKPGTMARNSRVLSPMAEAHTCTVEEKGGLSTACLRLPA